MRTMGEELQICGYQDCEWALPPRLSAWLNHLERFHGLSQDAAFQRVRAEFDDGGVGDLWGRGLRSHLPSRGRGSSRADAQPPTSPGPSLL